MLLAACSSASHSDNGTATTAVGATFRNSAAKKCYEKLTSGGTIDECPPNKDALVTVPDVVGKAACDALPVIVRAGLVPYATVASEITWTVTAQDPKPNKHVRRRSDVTLSLTEPTKRPANLSADCRDAAAVAAVP